ncbi:MAG: hypothetical protein VXW81_09355 [Pseudomonadota bacterium]|nr:hypothetical protein [Pseudomonadota bacterium]
MTDSTTPFDAAPYVTTAEAAAAFITAALDTDNAGHVAEALGVVARAQGHDRGRGRRRGQPRRPLQRVERGR